MKRYEWAGCVGAQETKPNKKNWNINIAFSTNIVIGDHALLAVHCIALIFLRQFIFFLFGFCVLLFIFSYILCFSLLFQMHIAHRLCSVSYLDRNCFMNFVAHCRRKSDAIYVHVAVWMSPHWDEKKNTHGKCHCSLVLFVLFQNRKLYLFILQYNEKRENDNEMRQT